MKTKSINLFIFTSLLIVIACERDWNNPWDEFNNLSPEEWAPQNLQIEDVTITEKKLTWTYDGDSRIEGFKLDRKKGDEPWQVAYQTFPKETREWNDTGIIPDPSLTYEYRLYAFAGKNSSSEETKSLVANFAAPTNLQTEKLSDKSYKLTWTDNSTGEQGFKIDRKIDENTWVTAFGTVPANQTSFIDTNVFRSTNVEYRVYGFYDVYESSKSSITSSAELLAPSNLQITPRSLTSVTINWIDNSNGEEGFKIDRKLNSRTWEIEYATVGRNQLSFTDNNVDWQTIIYSYRVYSYLGEYSSGTVENTISWPEVTTAAASNVTSNSATSGGYISIQGNYSITSRGVCYGTSLDPDLTGLHTTNSPATGSFTSSISGLSSLTTYYLRAYVTTNFGTEYGENKNFSTLSPAIGVTYAGRIVFYLDGNGGGLVCAPSDQSTGAEWGCAGTYIGGTSTAVGTGASNTAAIVAGCSESGIAARICNDLVLNGYNDWFLPSIDELKLMYQNLRVAGIGGFALADYWSSSERSSNYAWDQYFWNGSQGEGSKNGASYVRAVRAF